MLEIRYVILGVRVSFVCIDMCDYFVVLDLGFGFIFNFVIYVVVINVELCNALTLKSINV